MQQSDVVTYAGLERQRSRFERNSHHPDLQQLFLEVTPRCNLSCIHCGSRCDEHALIEEVSLDEYKDLLSRVRDEFGERVFIVLTGGEPMLRDDIYELGAYIRDLGFAWGMTTNATLIDQDAAYRLVESGLRTVSVSVDGLSTTHDAVRRKRGAYEDALAGVHNLAQTHGLDALQVTSVMNHQTIGEIDRLFEIMVELPIDSWRLVNVEPIGSALAHPELLFQPDDYARLFSFIREKREQKWPVSYGCSHYLGLGYEGALRNWFYFCNAGIHVMSVMHNGDIGSCLDIERREETVFGNIRMDDIAEVWRNGFGIYRQPNALADCNPTCSACSQKRWCRGDSAHSWDFNNGEPRVCMLRDLPGFVPVGDSVEGDGTIVLQS